MLQISQTENPTFSATIDQIRLRRATVLPVEFQNVSSSGFHSEIQVGLFSRISKVPFLLAVRQMPSRFRREAQRRALGRPQSGGVKNSDDVLRRTASMASSARHS